MKVHCNNCIPKEGIEIPDFTQNDKQILWKLKLKSPIHAVKLLIDDFKLSQRDAKYIVQHINNIRGKCHRCNFDNLDREYLACPKCKALNFNWKLDVK